MDHCYLEQLVAATTTTTTTTALTDSHQTTGSRTADYQMTFICIIKSITSIIRIILSIDTITFSSQK